MQQKQIENRLRRLEGQLASLRESIAEGKSCDTVITQFLAVKGACASAFEAYVKESLETCTPQDSKHRNELIRALIRK